MEEDGRGLRANGTPFLTWINATFSGNAASFCVSWQFIATRLARTMLIICYMIVLFAPSYPPRRWNSATVLVSCVSVVNLDSKTSSIACSTAPFRTIPFYTHRIPLVAYYLVCSTETRDINPQGRFPFRIRSVNIRDSDNMSIQKVKYIEPICITLLVLFR